MSTALITHPDCELHEISSGHPECPQRIPVILDQLKKEHLYDHLIHHDAPRADEDAPKALHGSDYVDHIINSAPNEDRVELDADTAMNPHSLDAALRGVGAALLATDLVMEGKVNNAFCCVRPPGHHAETSEAMGFCFFGNVALAAQHAISKHGLQRVAIVDFDVHHGNGTEDLVDGNAKILFCSSFQYPFYPGAYRPNVAGQRVNVPMIEGIGGDEFRALITETWLPALEQFRPELVIISAGFDAHKEDPLANIQLSDSDFVWITDKIMEVAKKHAQGRIVSVLEGGYSLQALSRCATAHVRCLMGL